MKRKALWRYTSLWLPVFLWGGIIFWLSSIPYLRITESPWDLVLRKVAHVGEYAVLARLIARALSGSLFWSWRKIFVLSLVVSVLYAATDEYHQTFVAGRVGCVRDVCVDFLGAWIGLGLRP